MDEDVRQFKWLIWASLFVMVATAGLSPLAPWGSGIPARDSAAFLYVGKVWAETGQGYLGAWDNKGPALFGLEALLHMVSPRLGLGVWVFEVICYCATALLLGSALRRMFDETVAGWATLVASATLCVTLQMGNYSEGFCLPLIAGAIWLVAHEKRGWWVWLSCAVMILVAGLMRVNNAVGLAMICFFAPMLYKDSAEKTVRWQVALIGCVLLGVFVESYRGVMGQREFREMAYAMWEFNRSYSSASVGERLYAILKVFLNLTNPVLLVGILAFTLAKGIDKKVWGWQGIFWVQVVALGIGSRTYMHYSVILLPTTAVLMGFVFSHFSRLLESRVWLVTIAILGVGLPFAIGVNTDLKGDAEDDEVRATVAALRDVDGETLYVLGHQASIYLLDGRRYESPMFADSVFQIPNNRREEYLREFGELVRRNPPDVIVFQRTPEEMRAMGLGDVVARYEVLPVAVEGQWPVGVLRL